MKWAPFNFIQMNTKPNKIRNLKHPRTKKHPDTVRKRQQNPERGIERKRGREWYQEQSWGGTKEEGNHRCKEGKYVWDQPRLDPSWTSNKWPDHRRRVQKQWRRPPNNTSRKSQIALTCLSVVVVVGFESVWDPKRAAAAVMGLLNPTTTNCCCRLRRRCFC